MTGLENLCMNCMADTAGSAICPKCSVRAEEPQMLHALPYRTVLQDRYVVGRARHSNGEGITYIGFDTVLNIRVEIHEFFPQTLSMRDSGSKETRVLGGSEILFDECLSKFLTLAREIAHLREFSTIEQIYDIFEENNTAYSVSEWTESISLRYFVERSGGSLNWNAARQLFMPVLSALTAMHERRINHLGISPDTLSIIKDGRLKLSGFCIDSIRRMDTDLPPEMVPGCAALEQYVMDYAPDESTDVYSFAATLFFALTGALPEDALRRKTDSRLMIPTGILRSLPPHVVTALANSLQLIPEKRTKTFERLRAELSAAPTVTAKIEETQQLRRAAPPPQKRGVPPFVWALVSCVAALGIFVGVGYLWLNPEPAASAGTGSEASSSQTSSSRMENSLLESVASDASQGDSIEIPDLVGKKLEELLSSTASSGQDYEVLLSDKQFSDSIPEGCVISQSPEAGKPAAKGTKIVVVISQGKASRTLPDIVGLSLVDASAKVIEAGFTPVKADAYSDVIVAETMIGYKDAKAGDQLPYGSQVVILLSKGPEMGTVKSE